MGSGEYRPGNRLLKALDEAAYRRVAARLKTVHLRARLILYRANEPIEQVYFPETAVICFVSVMADGGTIESATIGLEGASWVLSVARIHTSPCETVVAVAGEANVLDIADLERELQRNEAFSRLLARYSQAVLLHSLRMTACTGLHSLEQRCARWFLTALDRVSEDRLAITHEFLATLLGAVRPSVSAIVEDFHKRGILKLERGRVVIANREALRAASCECYEGIRRSYDHVQHP
jgi:CRP-like cAMP-binding protein